MTPQPRKPRSAGPKLFQCSGYGSCSMTFSRSEHLARHTRKHTGEKPFKCVVPECTRKFSRFDNMMQHTQTHDDETTSPQTNNNNNKKDNNNNIQRRMSVADLCNPGATPVSEFKTIHLTMDEFEALQGFGRFRYTPVYYDSLRDLASMAMIEPTPARKK
ncbi:hypothetical protein J3Q64DRAFT_1665205 [Phycomyces blakesleeanus]|uniref:C2H2-type domain-containing protein n=1 Tax=Phycomyces blakesleeanus TaxID=4837 RepID=A0ABR3AN70_PHYBL